MASGPYDTDPGTPGTQLDPALLAAIQEAVAAGMAAQPLAAPPPTAGLQMTTTPKLGLKQPALDDPALITDLNDNFTILDDSLTATVAATLYNKTLEAPVINNPTITGWTNANHTHLDGASGGGLSGAAITAGYVGTGLLVRESALSSGGLTLTDPTIRDTLFFAPEPTGAPDATLGRVAPGVLRADNKLGIRTAGDETGRPAGAQTAWQTGAVSIKEAGWEALNLWGDNAFGVNLNLFHTIGGQVWRGVSLSSRLNDATPGSQRTHFSVYVAGVGDTEPGTAAAEFYSDAVYLTVPTQVARLDFVGGWRMQIEGANWVFRDEANASRMVVWDDGHADFYGAFASTGALSSSANVHAGGNVHATNAYLNNILQCGYGAATFTYYSTDGLGKYGPGNLIIKSHDGANIQLDPTGSYVHPAVHNGTYLGHPSVRWLTVYTSNIDCSNYQSPGQFSASSGGGAPFVISVSPGGSLYLRGGYIFVDGTDTLGMLPERGNGILRLGDSAHKWIDVWANNGAIQTSSLLDKENWSTLERGEALDALRLLRFGRFDYLTNLDGPCQDGLISRHQIGYLAEETADRLRGAGHPDAFLLTDGKHVSPQHTASCIGAAVQDLDAEVQERLAALEERLRTLEARGVAA